MLTVFRWLLRLTVGLLVLAVLAGVLIWYFAIRSLPDYSATYQVSGITAPVEIVRSTENVPHIFGQTDADVFFALGVAHAQDRLFQMTLLRRAAQGRLAEIQGLRALPADDLARRLGLYRQARAAVDAQDAPTRQALAAYAAGVNQWIALINRNALGRGAPEFFLFPDEIAYWQPADSLAILKLLAAASSTAVADEVLRARLSLAWPQHGPDLLARPDVPRDLPSLAEVFPGARFPGINRRINSADRAPLSYLRPAEGLGGNAFAAGPRRTIGDATLLASDLHSALTAPGLFYLARLELASGGVIGATVPGMPVILSGRNPNLAWALTPLGMDDADIVMEEVQPGNPDRYRGPDGWHSFATRREVIRIRDADDQTITLRETRNGPVVPGIDPGLADVTPRGHVPALRWTGLEPQDTSMSALLGLMHAQDMDSGKAALVQMVAPALSVILASDSQIASLVAGKAPQRASDHPTAGAMPAPGWLAATQWSDPEILAQTPDRAESGVALTTDERPPDGLRLARLTRLLGDREVHSRDSFIAAQTDIVSPAARALLPLVGADLWFTEEPAAPGTAERRRQDALALLAEWDGAMNEHLPEPLLYAAWLSALQDRLVRDELGPLADDITRLHPAFIDAVFRNREGMARWCDIIQSAATEDCTTIARQALDRAIQDLTARFGPEVASWRWGDLHQARHQHPGLGSLSGLGWIANITQSVSGGDFTVARSGFFGRAPTPFAADRGAGFRGVFDLADPDSSVFIISTGQSGHPLSRHYDDLSGLWRRGEYIVMSLDRELARAASAGITTLVPAD